MTLNISTLTAHRVMSMRMRWTRGTDPWASLHITCPLSRKNVKRGLLMPRATQDLRVTSPSPGLVPEEVVPPYSGYITTEATQDLPKVKNAFYYSW